MSVMASPSTARLDVTPRANEGVALEGNPFAAWSRYKHLIVKA